MIEVQNEYAYPVAADMLTRAAAQVLDQHEQLGALTIVITTDEAVRALNAQFRGVDAATDVLSFPTDDDELMNAPLTDDAEVEPPYLGDLVIAFPYAQTQAARADHDLDHSLMLLVAHGTLHLLGYDHHDDDSRAAMWTAQARALTALGVPLEIVPTLENSSHDE